MKRSYELPGVECSLEYDASRRLTKTEDVVAGARINGFRYEWDRVSNRRFEQELTATDVMDVSTGFGSRYRYDSAYRLVREDAGVAGLELGTLTGNTSAQTPPPLTAASVNTWNLDLAGNRTETSTGGIVASFLSALGAPQRHREVNQVTSVSVGGASREREHDEAGKVLSEDASDGVVRRFDHRNQLVQVLDANAGTDVRYTYDAEGRRRTKSELVGNEFRAKVFVWDGWRCVSEFQMVGLGSVSQLVNEYVHGEGLDEVVYARVEDPASPNPFVQRIDLFYCHNSLGSVTAVVDSAGNVVERYAYEAYGKTTVLNPDRSVKSSQVPVQPYGFTGRRMDYEEGSGLYFYRNRYYDPEAGRFISRDPLGTWGDAGQRGNAQNYCSNNPVNRLDPLGLDEIGEREARLGAWLNENPDDPAYDGVMAAYIQACEENELTGSPEVLRGDTLGTGGRFGADREMDFVAGAAIDDFGKSKAATVLVTVVVSVAVAATLPASGSVFLAGALSGAIGAGAGYMKDVAFGDKFTWGGLSETMGWGGLFGGSLSKLFSWGMGWIGSKLAGAADDVAGGAAGGGRNSFGAMGLGDDFALETRTFANSSRDYVFGHNTGAISVETAEKLGAAVNANLPGTKPVVFSVCHLGKSPQACQALADKVGRRIYVHDDVVQFLDDHLCPAITKGDNIYPVPGARWQIYDPVTKGGAGRPVGSAANAEIGFPD